MKTFIHIFRHGKTYNPKHIVKGVLDFKLTKEGRNEITRLAKFYAKRPIKYIFHSPVLRAKQSAEIIKKYFPRAKLKQDKRLIEWETDWTGKHITAIKADPAMHWDLYKKDPLKFKVKKGQTAKQIVTQMNSFIKDIAKKYQGQEIIAVSHGDPIKLLRNYLENKKIDAHFHRYKCTQPSVTSFIFNSGKFKQVKYHSFIPKQNHLLE